MRTGVFYEQLMAPVTRYEIINQYCSDKKILDIGCVNHNIDNTHAGAWLHGKIKSVAKDLLGVDCLEEEVRQLRDRGYRVECADITRPVSIVDRFDVIVVGNLIEHLSGFEGFWSNMSRLLDDKGIILISTANPFYIDQYFYSAFKGRILINPEHTCWIDPVALDQLARRFGFRTQKVYWISEKWRLSQVICDNDSKQFDMLRGTWEIFPDKAGMCERAVSKMLRVLFKLYDQKRHAAALSKHGADKVEGLLYIQAMSRLFAVFWKVYRAFIIKSKLNEHELYMSVLERTHEDP